MKVFFFIFFLSASLNGQTLGNLYYDNKPTKYIPITSSQHLRKIKVAEKNNCNEFIGYILDKGHEKETVSSLSLINSLWLKEVKAYFVENTIVVIAEIKKDEYGIKTSKYIFCGMPSANWEAFYFGNYDANKTYGERFHKYIIDYECDCE